LLPNYFREPNVNLGFGSTFGQLPHVVGNKLLKEIGVPNTLINSLRVKAILPFLK
jgi:hypothetical protein